MTYNSIIEEGCKKEINKACKKNPILKKVITKRIEKILKNPPHYKPLKYDLSGQRRVHIMKSFVLKFKVDEENRIVKFIAFSHHDDAY